MVLVDRSFAAKIIQQRLCDFLNKMIAYKIANLLKFNTYWHTKNLEQTYREGGINAFQPVIFGHAIYYLSQKYGRLELRNERQKHLF